MIDEMEGLIVKPKLVNKFSDQMGEEPPTFPDVDEALSWPRNRFSMEDRMLHSLGIMFMEGIGAIQSFENAKVLFQKGADRGYAPSIFMLGCMYKDDTGVEKSYEKALQFFRKGAELGHVDAQFCLADMYYLGKGVNQSASDAMEWYSKAAEKGQEGACVILRYLQE